MRYFEMVREASKYQGLVSKKTLESTESFWDAHIVDSLLIANKVGKEERVIDIGSGAGFPGVVVAISAEAPTCLVEPRKLRAEFLRKVVKELGLNATVEQKRAAQVDGVYDVITARGVGHLSCLLSWVEHLMVPQTRILVIKASDFKRQIDYIRDNGLKLINETDGSVVRRVNCSFAYDVIELGAKNGYLLEMRDVVYRDI